MRVEKLDVTVREALHGDEDAIGRLWRQLFEFHARLDTIFSPAPEGEFHYKRWVRYHLDDAESFVVVGTLGGEVIGYVMAQIKTLPPVLEYRRIGSISDMAVDEAVRGRGIGRKIYDKMEKILLSRGVTRIEVKTSSRNPISNHFWEEVCGYKEFVKARYKNFDEP